MGRVFVVFVLLAALTLPTFAEDSLVSHKLLHVAAGTGISALVTEVTKSPKAGLFAGISAGVAKEIHDRRATHESYSSCARDIAVTSAGPIVVYLIARRMFKKKTIAQDKSLVLEPGVE
jgi:hypothetical protein